MDEPRRGPFYFNYSSLSLRDVRKNVVVQLSAQFVPRVRIVDALLGDALGGDGQ